MAADAAPALSDEAGAEAGELPAGSEVSGETFAAAGRAAERLAPAKVNLYLHLCGRRTDGYHLLDSLVVFPGIGDKVSVAPSATLSLAVSGPFGAGLPADAGNLVLRAAAALAQAHAATAGAAIRLRKDLPVAAGIGGGSSDAAAALALLARLWGVAVPEGLALALGADVPVCCAAPSAMRMQGIGERLSPAPALPAFWLVLVNPLVPTPTGAVFAGVSDRCPPPGPPAPSGGFAVFEDLLVWLRLQRNDLEASAAALCPAIGDVLAALTAAGAPLARMSGSGATCFGLVPDEAAAGGLATRLRRARPDWWVASGAVACTRTARVPTWRR
jgi:4-diphosphocytidyl-2-C-methyl-D-erythritol kinase